VRYQDGVLLWGCRARLGSGRKKDLALPQSLGVKRIDCVVLRCCFESFAIAGSQRVCAAICFIRLCTLVRLGGIVCWEFLTDHPSEGGM